DKALRRWPSNRRQMEMECDIRRTLSSRSGATSEVSGATLHARSAWGVFNFGGPYPPKSRTQKFRDRWKTLQKALIVLPNTHPRTPKIKNKNIYNYILSVVAASWSASWSARRSDNFGGGSPKSDTQHVPSRGYVAERSAETRRNYFEARRHS